MSLKQCQSLFACSVECAGEHRAVSPAQLPAVCTVSWHLLTHRCFLPEALPTCIISPLAFSNSLVPSEHLAAHQHVVSSFSFREGEQCIY